MHYVTSFEEILWGVALVTATIGIHGCGMVATLLVTQSLSNRADRKPSFMRHGGVLIVAAWMIVLLHLFELLMWAGFFLWQGAMPNASTAYYYALTQYTTVGSSVSLPPRWQLFDGMLPISGLMTFAWSTGVLFALAERFQGAQLAAIHARRKTGRARHEPSRER